MQIQSKHSTFLRIQGAGTCSKWPQCSLVGKFKHFIIIQSDQVLSTVRYPLFPHSTGWMMMILNCNHNNLELFSHLLLWIWTPPPSRGKSCICLIFFNNHTNYDRDYADHDYNFFINMNRWHQVGGALTGLICALVAAFLTKHTSPAKSISFNF